MDDGLKQRLIGAVVLVAVGVIFIPSLLDEDGRRKIDITTQVPPEPVVMPTPLEVADPMPPENIPPIKPLEENYSHQDNNQEVVSEVDTAIVETIPSPVNSEELGDELVENIQNTEPVSALTKEGVPQAWSVQVSSFSSEKNATAFQQKLVEAKFPAYVRSNTVNGNTVHRVFVGPKINREIALETKAKIDKAYSTNSLLVEFKP